MLTELLDVWLKSELKFRAEHKTDTCNQDFCVFEKARNDAKAKVEAHVAELSAELAAWNKVNSELNKKVAELEARLTQQMEWDQKRVEGVLSMAAELRTQKAELEAERDAWKNALDNEAVVTWTLSDANANDPKKMLSDIINWHVQVATDPKVNGGMVLVSEQEVAELEADRNDLREGIKKMAQEIAELEARLAASEAGDE